jgi:hypothetical protein
MAQTWQDRTKELFKRLELKLSDDQSTVFFNGARVVVGAGGEGSGKSQLAGWYAGARAIDDAYRTNFQEDHLYWIVGMDFEDARKEANYLIEFLERLDLFDRAESSLPNQDQVIIKAPEIRATFMTISAYDPTKIGREEPNGIIGAEISRWTLEIWRRCMGRLMRKYPLAWGWFTGSFETSESWFAEVYELGQSKNVEDIVSVSLPSWANPVVYPGGREDPAIKVLEASMPSWRFWERHGGRPAPPQDSVYGEFRRIFHVDERVDYNPAYPVHLAIDPGDKCYCVLYVQFVEDEVIVLDEVYVEHWTHEQIIQAAQLKSAWQGTGHGGHSMDIAGSARIMGNETAVNRWYADTGRSFSLHKYSKVDQVQKMRTVLAINPRTTKPYLRISPKCPGFINELGGGVPLIDGIGRWRMKAGVPEKANNHACDALSYLLLAHFGAQNTQGANLDTDQARYEPVSYVQGKSAKKTFTPMGPWSYYGNQREA